MFSVPNPTNERFVAPAPTHYEKVKKLAKKWMHSSWFWLFLILVCLGLLSIISMLFSKNNNNNNTNSGDFKYKAEQMYAQSSYMSNPLLALNDASQAVAYALVAQEAVPNDVAVQELVRRAQVQQQQIMRVISNTNPNLSPYTNVTGTHIDNFTGQMSHVESANPEIEH